MMMYAAAEQGGLEIYANSMKLFLQVSIFLNKHRHIGTNLTAPDRKKTPDYRPFRWHLTRTSKQASGNLEPEI